MLTPGASLEEGFGPRLEEVERKAGHAQSLDSRGMDRPPITARATSRERVLAALADNGLSDVCVTEFPESTATAVAAAEALGTPVERIVKSLVFMAGDRPVLVLASGTNRVDLHKLAHLAGEPVGRANADQVRQATGFAIGGVPPVGHTEPLSTYVDADLLRYDEVWAAAGTPYSVFAIHPQTLARVSGGHIVDIAQR
jgi:prolyl-tRNA editing enzyme YbaK/EbsC (Cys-tRNA(Pro) deacylase)